MSLHNYIIESEKRVPVLLDADVVVAGCGNTTASRTGSGAVAGAATGAAIGSFSGDAGKGALIGAGVGALGGLAVDQHQKEQERQREEELRRYPRDSY